MNFSFFVFYLYNSGRLIGMEQKIEGMFDVNLTECQKMIQNMNYSFNSFDNKMFILKIK